MPYLLQGVSNQCGFNRSYQVDVTSELVLTQVSWILVIFRTVLLILQLLVEKPYMYLPKTTVKFYGIFQRDAKYNGNCWA